MIVNLSVLRMADLPTVGGKAANLGELIAAGLPVPPGFCVTTAAHRTATASVADALAAAVAAGDATAARALVEGARPPDGLADRIDAALAELGPGPVAVRSSATAEDLAEASFAGQQESYLGVVGAADVLAAVRRCWGSAWTERAIAYRRRHGFAHDAVEVAVVVQRLVPADVSGVLFTADPVTGRTGETAVDASWGLGETVVSGSVTPDAFVVRAGRVVSRTVGTKAVRLDTDATGVTHRTDVPDADRGRLCLSDDQVLALADLGDRVRAHHGREMDVEWAFAGGRPWLLQARPITSAPAPDADAVRGDAVADDPPVTAPRAGRLSRWVHDDIVEHFPAPHPLDLAVVDLGVAHLLGAMELAGVRVSAPGGLIETDADGVSRVAYPHVSPAGVPGALLRLARTGPVDPRSWADGPGGALDRATARLAGVDLGTLPDAALADRWAALWQAGDRMLRARFQEYLPWQVVWGAQIDLLLRVARRSDLTQFDLLTDLDFATVVIDRGLRRLASDARARPAVRAALAAVPLDADAVRRADPGWWASVEEFLAAHGGRTTGLYAPFSHRSWGEDRPAFLATVATLLDAAPPPGAGVPHAELVADVTRRLPRPLRRRFGRLVEDYRAGHVVREHSVTQMERLVALARATAREAEARMVAAGALDAPGDVTFLTAEELLGWLGGDPTDLRARVGRRRAARPRAEAAWWGAAARTTTPGVLANGAPGSPGRATGTVCVVTRPEEFTTLAPGDVLVCQFTDPSWTPLFQVAAAVVADHGGRLSHAAIVAREYRIPAVLGTGDATTRLRPGRRVTVDGSRGVVLAAD